MSIISGYAFQKFKIFLVFLSKSALFSFLTSTPALTGALAWLFIVAPTSLTNILFAGFPFKVWFIEAGNHLVNFILFGALLGLWR